MNDELRLNNEDRIAGNGNGNRPRRARRILVLLILLVFVSVVWYAFSQGQQMGISQVTPVIKADAEPYKVKPDQPGGMEIPHQDKLVYDQIQGNTESQSQPEKLVPAPEQPIAATPKMTPAIAAAIPATNDTPITAVDKTAKPNADGEKPPESLDLPPAQEIKSVPTVTPKSADTELPEPIVPANSKKPNGAKSEVKKADAPAKDTPTSKPAEKTPAANGKHRVQLVSLPDKGQAEKALANFKSKFASKFPGHEFTVRAANIPNKGIFYRVQIGGFADRAAANDACATLKSNGQGCIYVAP